MSNNGFDSIAQAVLKQKQMMDELERQNRELRRQIADLRAGRGIFVEIAGHRFPLGEEITRSQVAPGANVTQQEFLSSPTTSSLPEVGVVRKRESRESRESEEVAGATPTLELSPIADRGREKQEEKGQEKAPTFLEEIMFDEFAAASTSPMAVWNGPVKKQEQEQIDEEQKAALRRELMGSFLLE